MASNLKRVSYVIKLKNGYVQGPFRYGKGIHTIYRWKLVAKGRATKYTHHFVACFYASLCDRDCADAYMVVQF